MLLERRPIENAFYFFFLFNDRLAVFLETNTYHNT